MVCVVLSSSLLVAQKSKVAFSLQKIPDQSATVHDVPVVAARQHCENFAFATALETILGAQKVELDQAYWTDKINGGALCLESPGELEKLAKFVDGDYVLGDARRVQLQSTYFSGVPTRVDQLLVPIIQGRPIIFWWKGHAYVATAARWDEFVYPNGQRDILINEISLIDPYQPQRELKFLAGKDRFEDINGIFDVLTTIDETNPWKSPH